MLRTRKWDEQDAVIQMALLADLREFYPETVSKLLIQETVQRLRLSTAALALLRVNRFN